MAKRLLGGVLPLMVLLASVTVTPAQGVLELQISATCENALLLVNGRLYSGRPFTITVPLGATVTLENLSA
ncbi:MAG: hypothetical protein NZO41_03375, partial [Candidatus Bipolaricaulota bacterium]|nr:hypothetical protein [Candidatus Bipolaricaulota bacterium]